MKKRKTWMALFLCLCMAFMLLPASVLAASAGDITIALADGSDPSLGTSGTAGDGDYYYENNVLYINSGTAMTLSGTSTADRIIVSQGVTANLTLSGLSITSGVCAFDMSGATVNLTLIGSNSITSGGTYAGIYVPQNATLTITSFSTGSLDISANRGAGIGVHRGQGETCGKVNIFGGTVNAVSTFGAGIGCAYHDGAGGVVAISGADTVVTATGGNISDGIVFVPDIGGSRLGNAAQGSLTVSDGATLTLGKRGLVSTLTSSFTNCVINGAGAGNMAGTYVSYSVEQSGGASGTADSTGINIVFGQEVTGLTANNITITDDTGAAEKGTLSGSGKNWTLSLAKISAEGNIKLAISDWTDTVSTNNFIVTTEEQTVNVYKNTAPAFVPVADIAMTNANSVQVNTELTLAGTVAPDNATNKEIEWSVENANGTGAVITSGVFTASKAGAATIKATVINGAGESANYSKIFEITVTEAAPAFVPVADIAMTNASSVQVNTELTLAGTVAPDNATNKEIEWSVENANGTGAVITNGVFTASKAGTATIKATVINGADESANYSKTFEITVTGVSDIPQTGDESNVALWITLLVLASVGMIGTTVLSRKHRIN